MNDVPAIEDGSQRPAGPATVPAPRAAIVLDGAATTGDTCRVYTPGRVLRAWALLNAAGDELHQVTLSPAAVQRLHFQLHAVMAELERAVSPDLAAELHRLICPDQPGPATEEELRVEHATVLGWAGGLVMSMLSELQDANSGQPPGPG